MGPRLRQQTDVVPDGGFVVFGPPCRNGFEACHHDVAGGPITRHDGHMGLGPAATGINGHHHGLDRQGRWRTQGAGPERPQVGRRKRPLVRVALQAHGFPRQQFGLVGHHGTDLEVFAFRLPWGQRMKHMGTLFGRAVGLALVAGHDKGVRDKERVAVFVL